MKRANKAVLIPTYRAKAKAKAKSQEEPAASSQLIYHTILYALTEKSKGASSATIAVVSHQLTTPL
jgi:hypothetical protein